MTSLLYRGEPDFRPRRWTVLEEINLLLGRHYTAQPTEEDRERIKELIAGANMVLVDFHPAPPKALVDGPQALLLKELPYFLEDVKIAREAYLKRVELRQRQA